LQPRLCEPRRRWEDGNLSFQTDIAAGFNDAQTVLGGITATWNSATVPIVIGDNSLMITLIEGGFLEGFAFGFTCKDTDAPGDGRAGNRIAVDGKTYRVLKIMANPGNPLLNVFCGGVDQ
jgi:hypothetical protein